MRDLQPSRVPPSVYWCGGDAVPEEVARELVNTAGPIRTTVSAEEVVSSIPALPWPSRDRVTVTNVQVSRRHTNNHIHRYTECPPAVQTQTCGTTLQCRDRCPPPSALLGASVLVPPCRATSRRQARKARAILMRVF